MRPLVLVLVLGSIQWLCPSVQAGVVGISPNGNPSDPSASTQGFSFQTTGLAGSKISGIGLYGNYSDISGISVRLWDGGVFQLGTFNYGQNKFLGQENAITWNNNFSLAANTTYSLMLFNVTIGDFWGIGGPAYQVAPGIQDYWTNPQKGANTDLAISLYDDPTSVPEPSTVILVSGALASLGLFKRLRHSKAGRGLPNGVG